MPDFSARDAELRSQGLFAAEGRLLVERAFQSGLEVVRVFADSAAGEEARALFPAAQILSAEGLSREAGYPFHRGMVAHVRRPEPRIAVGREPPCGPILALPKVTDPGNLGTLLRSALAFGFTSVLMGAECLDPFNRKALRASMGASYRLKLLFGSASVLAEWADTGVEPIAAALEPGAASIDAWQPSAGKGFCLVLGNEYDGIPGDWRTPCRRAVMIPVTDAVDSLNVAVAGSILMRELSRRGLP